jgi:hypothetical protein
VSLFCKTLTLLRGPERRCALLRFLFQCKVKEGFYENKLIVKAETSEGLFFPLEICLPYVECQHTLTADWLLMKPKNGAVSLAIKTKRTV